MPKSIETTQSHAGDHFSQSLAVYGTTLAVGAWGDSDHGNDAGAVHLFEWHTNSWTQTAKLHARDAGPFQFFGASIAHNGHWLATTSCAGRGIYEAGRVHLFIRSGRSWREAETLPFESCTNQSNLLAMTESMIVVGIPGKREARIYTVQDGQFHHSASLSPLETRLYSMTDDFAQLRAVVAENDRIVIALENGAGVFTFRLRDSEWIEGQKLSALDGSLSFGSAVALDGDRLLIGDPAATVCSNGECMRGGIVYVFEWRGDQWQQAATLQPSTPVAESWFGGSLLLVQNTAVVGAPMEIAGSFGAAYRFHFCDGVWTQNKRLVAGPFPRTETARTRGLAEMRRALRNRRFAGEDLVSAIRGGFNYPIMLATGPALAVHNDELLIGSTRGALNGRSAIYRFPFRTSC